MALEVSALRFCWNSLTQLLTVETISRAASCALFLFTVSVSSTRSTARLRSLRLIIFIGAFFVIMTCTSSPNDCLPARMILSLKRNPSFRVQFLFDLRKLTTASTLVHLQAEGHNVLTSG